MDNKTSITALMSAFARGYHAENCKNPIFSDCIARRLMSDSEYEQMRAYICGGIDFFAPEKKGSFKTESDMLDYIINTQLAPTPIARARYCEDSLRTAVATGTSQYVILGAGFDTFAWRENELMKKLSVFEVDHPLTQEDKKRRIAAAGLDIPENLRFVPVDFATDDLRANLKKAGFDEKKKTFFSWLGVSYYLTDGQIEKLLENISSFASEGSTLLFDFADEGLFSAKEKRVCNMVAMAAAGGEPMRFCTDEMSLTLMLEKYHFLIYELLSPQDIEREYFSQSDNGLSAFEHISYVLAVIKGTQFIGTKEKILQTALHLFARKGFDAVSVSDISGGLGITKGALYKHYADKRDIFDSIVERMAENDAEKAKEASVPETAYEKSAEKYKRASLDSFCKFTSEMFDYWTRDAFASDFRKMLTVEQFKDVKSAELYQQYLCSGPLSYTEKLLSEITHSENAEQLALDFYAPVFQMYALYDGSADKEKVRAALKNHIEKFTDRIKEERK